MDFTYDRITDLHIALDELCSRIIAACDPAPRRLDLTFAVEEQGLRVRATGDTPLKDGVDFLNPWSKVILESVTDGIEVAGATGVPVVTIVVGRGPAA
jgi:hypothetical protein